MADLSITAASVVAGANAVIARGTFGEAVTAGQPVYLDTASKKWFRADCNSATAAARQAGGVALNGGALNQPATIQTGGDITIGATLTPGSPYYLSANAGAIMPSADLATTDYVCQLGLASSATVLHLDIQFPNVVL